MTDRRTSLMLVGPPYVGKTSIIRCITGRSFVEDTEATYWLEYHNTTGYYFNIEYTLGIWDTAGEERFGEIMRNYYHMANGFILVISPDRSNWKLELDSHLRRISDCTGDGLPIMGIINKCDMATDSTVIKGRLEEMPEYMWKTNKFSAIYCISAKNGTINVAGGESSNKILTVMNEFAITYILREGGVKYIHNHRESIKLDRDLEPVKKCYC